jgi:hypothetical protein
VDWLVNVVWSLWSWVMGREATATALVISLCKLLENALLPVNSELLLLELLPLLLLDDVNALLDVATKPPWAGNELIVPYRPKL